MALPTATQRLPRWVVTPSAGGVFGSDLDEPSATVGIAVGLAAARRLTLESEISRVAELAGLALPLGSAWLFSGRLLYLAAPADARVVPYGSIGGSFVRLTRAGEGNTEVEIAGTAGGGSFVRLATRLWLRGDLRFIHVNDAPNFWRGSLGLTVGFD